MNSDKELDEILTENNNLIAAGMAGIYGGAPIIYMDKAKQRLNALIEKKVRELQTKLDAQEMFLHEAVREARVDELKNIVKVSNIELMKPKKPFVWGIDT